MRREMRTKADMNIANTISNILEHGTDDINPRPHWKDGTPAHTVFITHVINRYNFQAGDSAFMTLRPVAVMSGIKEILWIYQDQSNDLRLLNDKYNVNWWDSWDIGDGTIGSCYGATIKQHKLMDNLLDGLVNDPFGRRHILSLWQDDDFNEKHGLKPCCFMTIWSVRSIDEEAKHRCLDCMLIQRSSDYLVSGNINQLQYIALQRMICGHLINNTEYIYTMGNFTHVINNCHIYDRHIEQAYELIHRSPILFAEREQPKIVCKPKNFYDYTIDDFEIVNYPKDAIKINNPQLHFEVAI